MNIKHNYKIIIITVLIAITISQTRSTDPSIFIGNIDDILQGNGLFIGPSISQFQLDSDHTVDFINWGGSSVLK
jgi:hypothetical protein